ncbi:MAG TPA: hypothetical protein PLQ83_15810, partial [Thermoflexales bacterium]|nr:hypothetical protein [Thermoflexales bacterium]
MKRASLSFLTGPGAARVLLAAALLATSLSSSVPAGPESTTPGSPIAAMTETPRLIQRILADEFEAQPIESDEAGELPTFPDLAAAFRRLQLKDEKGEIPPEALSKANSLYAMARDRTRLSPSPAVGGISPGAWTAEGPTNVGGRIRSIVIPPDNPDWLLIGGVGGGVWVSDTTGWHPANDSLPNLAISAMAANPVTGNIIYAGTGEGFHNADALRGDGIFVSNDSGQSWSQLSSTAQGGASPMPFVNRLAVSADGAVLLSAARDGLFYSADGGSTWVNRLPGTRTLDAQFHPTSTVQALASGDGWVKYSLNKGATWNASSGFPGGTGRIELGWSKSNPLIVYASVDNNSGDVYKSIDGGASFTLVNTGQSFLAAQGWYDNVVWVNPVNPNDVIVGGVDIYRSTNGAVNFSQIGSWSQYQDNSVSVHADHHVIVAPRDYDGVITKTIWFGNDGGLFRVDDLALATTTAGWTHIVGPDITQFYGVAASNGGGTTRILGGAQDNGTPLNSGPPVWTYLYGGDGGSVAIDPGDSRLLYGEYVHLEIVRSRDGGATQASRIDKPGAPGIGQITDSRTPTNALFIAPFILDPNNSNTMLAGGASLWRSANISSAVTMPSWAAIKPPLAPGGAFTELISAIAVANGNSDVIWVGHQEGSLFKTTNGTAPTPSWTQITFPDQPTRYLTRIVFDPNSTQVVYLTYGGFTNTNVLKTIDGGATWMTLPGTGLNALPAVPVRAFAVHPNNTSVLYAGTEVGIFASDDGGINWGVPADGPAHVSIDQLTWLGQRLYAATHGRGIWSISPSIAGIPTPTPTPSPTPTGTPTPPAACATPAPQGSYGINVVARTGDNGVLELYDGVSINDKGNVSFVGRLADTDAIYVGSNVTNVRKLTPTDGFYTYYWPSAQINNSDQIIARDYANGYRYNRIWNGLPGNEGLYTLLPGGSTRDMLTYGSINDNNEVVYPFLYKNTLQGGMATFPNDHAIGMTTGALRPVIDNNGYSVVRMGDADNAPIAMFAPDLSGNTSIAGNAFSAKGRRPSISGQSEAVSFYANFANPAGVGGGPGGGNPGEGTFISLDRAKIPDLTGGRELYRITGQACNGQLDPGEAHNDVNADGVVDPNEDAGFIFHYDIEKRVAINRNVLGDKHRMNIAFVGTDIKGPAVFESDIILPYPAAPGDPVTPTVNTYRVIGVGDVITGVNGAVKDVSIGERLTKYGEVVIWIKTDSGQEAIVRAAPQMRRPVILIPGLLGTGQKPGDTSWFKARGLPPDALALDPILGAYDDVVQTLTNFGYQKDRDLFVVKYDWRLPPAAPDGAADGYLADLTAEGIVDTVYATGVDYLGDALKKAANAWKYFHPGEPDLDAVDVIAHDAGGLIARAYIQSDAYAGPIPSAPLSDGSPGPASLPGIRNLILAGVPNMGDVRSWSGVIDNWRDNAVMRFLLSRLVYAEYLFVQTNPANVIAGPGYGISAGSLSTDTLIRNRDFISQYVPTLNSMLATYP